MQCSCPQCGVKIEFPESAGGKRGRCARCNSVFSLPENTRIGSVQESTVAAPRKEIKNTSALNFEQRREKVMAGFSGIFVPPKTSLSYRFGLLVTAGISIALPLLYLCFIGLVIWLVYLHLRYDVGMLQTVRGRNTIWIYVLYLAPIAIGLIAVLFMLKPLFAPTGKQAASRFLNAEQEPLLFAFVSQICRDLRAPVPRRIDITWDVNASASFRNGWWSFLRRDDLVLTLGMPLVTGLTTRQLAGVLAHEFGHFSQGAGMRLTYVIQSINHWFYRVVYERDAWDEALEEASQQWDFRFGVVLYAARGVVWLSRKVLLCLLLLGSFLTGFMQRQMEFDADRYQTAMAGKTTFGATFRRLRLLGLGFGSSVKAIERSVQEKRFIDNLPGFVAERAKCLPATAVAAIDEEIAAERTGFFDSHPCDRERITAVERSPDDGRYRGDMPATALFLKLKDWCMLVTRDFYEQELEVSCRQARWVAYDKFLREEVLEDAGTAALQRYGQDCLLARRRLPLPAYRFEATGDVAVSIEALKRARKMLQETYIAFRDGRELHEYEAEIPLRVKWIEAIKPCVDEASRECIREIEAALHERKRRLDPEKVNRYTMAVGARWYQACRLLSTPQLRDKLDDAEQLVVSASAILKMLQAIEPLMDRAEFIEDRFAFFIYAAEHVRPDSSRAELFFTVLFRTLQEAARQITYCCNQLNKTPYPFADRPNQAFLGEMLLNANLDSKDLSEIAAGVTTFTDGFYRLQERAWGALALIAERVEQAVGFDQLDLQESNAT
jgi:Zn-dependent protease with chaperone function